MRAAALCGGATLPCIVASCAATVAATCVGIAAFSCVTSWASRRMSSSARGAVGEASLSPAAGMTRYF